MPIISSSPWLDAANVGSGLGASLTNLLIDLPRLRQQQQLQQAQMELYRAEAERYRAQAPTYEAQATADRARAGAYDAERDLRKAQMGEIGSVELAKERLGNALRHIPTTVALGGSIDPLISTAVDNLARLPHADRASLGETLAQMLEMSNPKFRTALGLGAKSLGPSPVNVPAGSTLVNPESGESIYQSPRTLGYGQQMVPGGGGAPLATAQDRPLAADRLGSVFGAFARAAAEEAQMSGKDPREALTDFLGTISGTQPNFGNRVVGGTNTPPRVEKRRYWNPSTGQFQDAPL
jgi:hypothetical protein